MNIFRRHIREKYIALATVVSTYMGYNTSYQSVHNIKMENLTSLRVTIKKEHGIELELITKGKLMIIDITITL